MLGSRRYQQHQINTHQEKEKSEGYHRRTRLEHSTWILIGDQVHFCLLLFKTVEVGQITRDLLTVDVEHHQHIFANEVLVQ